MAAIRITIIWKAVVKYFKQLCKVFNLYRSYKILDLIQIIIICKFYLNYLIINNSRGFLQNVKWINTFFCLKFFLACNRVCKKKNIAHDTPFSTFYPISRYCVVSESCGTKKIMWDFPHDVMVKIDEWELKLKPFYYQLDFE